MQNCCISQICEADIGEILQWAAREVNGEGFRLCLSQIHALETYWYLRLCQGMPHTIQLYRKMFLKVSDLLDSIGLSHPDTKDSVLNEGLDATLTRIKNDDEFVRKFRLEALRETLTLAYPSYIFALAMGTGKRATASIDEYLRG